MSGESASVMEVCAVAADATLVAARAVGGVARTGLQAPGAGLSAVGRRMEQGYVHQRDRQAELAEWEDAARQVVERNSRLSVLAARPGGMPGLPPPLAVQGQRLAQLTEWCAAADRALAGAERALLDEAASALSVVLTSVAGGSTDAAGLLTKHREADAAAPPELIEACGRILSGLSADVPADDRAEVLAAVAQVRECRTAAERQSWLAELRVRVRVANGAAERRREQTGTAATMLQALADSGGPRAVQLRAELADVVAGHRVLDPGLRQEALAACAQVRAERESGYVRESLARALEKLGYQVDQGFDTFTGDGSRLRLVRDQWPEHAVSMIVDGAELRTMVVRTESAEGDDAARLDLEREQQWCTDFEELREQVAVDGLRLDVQRLVAPGERHVPLAGRGQRKATRGQSARQQNRPPGNGLERDR
ncbi:MAG TPA: hypothetical protein VGJ13_21610 [Pseudonocardiaceae bacterium]|jgi:hypothetical protein